MPANSRGNWSASRPPRRGCRRSHASLTMRTSHKKRLARLVAALDESESEAIDRRCTLRFYAYVCEDIREAMEWRGIDPACSRPLLAMEAKLAGFVDTPELRDTDGAYCAAKQAEALAEGD